jgi:hypothetical protein
MRVLFLALGGDRRPAVIAESRTLVAAGGRPTVLVSGPERRADEGFAPAPWVAFRIEQLLTAP